jgi:DNA mismatch repair protein MutL
LNGRYVRDRSLSHALREAYRGLLEGGRQPVAFLFLTIQPDRVDVNVHPTKIEVRLRDGHLLYGQMLAAVRGRLLGPGITPHIAPPLGETPQAGAAGGPTSSDADRDARVRQAVAEFLRSPQAQAQSRILFTGRADQPRPATSREAGDVRPPVYSPGAKYGAPGAAQEAPAAAAPPQDAAPLRAVQLHNTYLVAETADGILIVDQHALHERIIFEEIMARLEAGPLEAQRYLLPVTASLTDREIAAIDEHREALAHLGIEAEAIGPRTVAVHAFPTLLSRAEPTAVLRDFLAWALTLDSPPTARQVLEKLAHVAACRAAVKAGDPLKHEEIEALLARRAVGDLAATCPHGRPTALVLSKSDLEKQFGRDYAAPPKISDEPLPF